MKTKMLEYFIDVTRRTAKLSTCQSRQVGAVLVKDDRILAIGYNGTAKGMDHCKSKLFNSREEHSDWSELNELHAEQNIIAFCSKEGIKTKDTILFLSISPCINCAKLIVSTGIKTVLYEEKYDLQTSGIKFLNDAGICCEKILESYNYE